MTHMILYLSALAVLAFASQVQAYSTGTGSIIIEEAVSMPFLMGSATNPPPNVTVAQLAANLLDIHDQRLTYMDESGVDYMVLSCASPCIQGISDPATALNLSIKANNYLAAQISNNTARFGAFAALAMHNATAAGVELRRAVTELGFLGALVNDYQQSGADNATLLYYDMPQYDAFWAVVQELDVPVYFHPRTPISQVTALDFAHSPWLLGAPHQFAVELSNHIVGLCANGIFDRFPKLKVIVGHLGERIPSDFWRIDEMLARKKASGMPMNRTFSTYWQTNLWETTSGNFGTDLFHFHSHIMGLDRILYSVDYPYVMMDQSAAWVTSLDLGPRRLAQFTRNNAIKLLGLNQKGIY